MPKKNDKRRPVLSDSEQAAAMPDNDLPKQQDLPASELAEYLRASTDVIEKIVFSMLPETGASSTEIDAINRDPVQWVSSIPPTFDHYLGWAHDTSDMSKLIETQRGKQPDVEVVQAHNLLAAVTLAHALETARTAATSIEQQHFYFAARQTIHAWNLLLDAATRVNAQGAAITIAKSIDQRAQLDKARGTQNKLRTELAKKARDLATATLFPEWRKSNPDADATIGYDHVAAVLSRDGYRNANGATITGKTVKEYFRKPRRKKGESVA